MRLLESTDFTLAFANGKRVRCGSFTLVANKNDLEHPRLGLAISRKAAARAVDRNRIKRIVRESFRSNASTMGPLDIVVRATPIARTQSNSILSRKLNILWRKLK